MRITGAVSVLVVSVLSTTSLGTITAMAATQTQSQGLYANQSQEVDTTGNGTVSQGQTSVLKSKQTEKTGKQTSDQRVLNTNQSFSQSNQDHTVTGQTGYSQNQKSKVLSEMNKTVTTSSTVITTNAKVKSNQRGTFNATGNATVTQTTTTTILGGQSQQAPGAVAVSQLGESAGSAGSGLILSSLFSSSSSSGSVSSFSMTGVTFDTQHNTIVSKTPVAGYAVFDLAGNRISDTFGGTSNATAQYEQFQPNQPVVLILRPVDANGNPVQNLIQATVYLKSSNSSSKITRYGDTFSALLLSPGSYGVSFVYTNTGNTPGYDVIDPTSPPNHHHRSEVTLNATQKAHLHLSQTEQASTSSGVKAQQTQATGTQSQQSQDNRSQLSGAKTSQNQETSTKAATTLTQNETTNVTTNEAQSANATSGANGSVNINLQQAQSVQSNGTGTATESQGTSFGAEGSMQVSFSQSQQSSTTGALQSEGIHVSESDPNGASSKGGNLSVYLNGQLKGQYSGVTGAVTASQSQTTGTGSSSSNQESNQVSYDQNGKTVTVSIQ